MEWILARVRKGGKLLRASARCVLSGLAIDFGA